MDIMGGVSALHATLTAGVLGMGWLLPPPKMPPKESKLHMQKGNSMK